MILTQQGVTLFEVHLPEAFSPAAAQTDRKKSALQKQGTQLKLNEKEQRKKIKFLQVVQKVFREKLLDIHNKYDSPP